jgi:chromosomal replication initiator protein
MSEAPRYWFWMDAPVFPGDIIKEVAARHDLTVEELKSTSRARRLAWPRQEAMYELRMRTKLSYPQIARFLGLTDHTTALHGVKAHKRRQKARAA